MEKFSKVTTYHARRRPTTCWTTRAVPPQVRRLMRNPEVQTLQEEFDSARIYLARVGHGHGGAERAGQDTENMDALGR